MSKYKDEKLLRDLYKKHKSQVKVAKVLGCNSKTVAAWMKKFDIKTVGSQGARKNRFNEDYFKEIDTQDKAYWLGFLMADGCVYRGSDSHSYRLQINLQARDISILESFQKSIESNYKIQKKKVLNSDVCILKVNSTKMCKDLMSYGVVPRKSSIAQFPKLEEGLIRHFVRGYFDGDGGISKSKNRVNYRSIKIIGTQSLLETMKKFLDGYNINSNIYDIKESEVKSLEISKSSSVSNFKQLIYKNANLYLSRKKSYSYESIVHFRSNPIDKT